MKYERRMEASAHFSDDGKHRYELRRQWNKTLPPFVVIMLNPSTANAISLDPTCMGVMKRAVRRGYGEMIVLNVGAGVNTHPSNWRAMRDPIGPLNYKIIRRVLQECKERGGIVVAGWGTQAPSRVVENILDICHEEHIELWAFDVTKDGHPKHPLYVLQNKELERWRGFSSYPLRVR